MIESLAPKKKDEFWTVPNFITLLGFLLIILYLQKNAFIFLFLAGATDALDGFVARKLKQESFWGAIIDPLRDRLIMGAILWNFWLTDKVGNFILLIVLVEIAVGIVNLSTLNLDKKISHFFGKMRQVGHLCFGTLGIFQLISIQATVSIILLFSIAAFGGTASLIKRRN